MIAIGILLDQITKWLAVIFLKGNPSVPSFVEWFMQFTYVENRGAAWGMFADQRWVFITISTVAIIGVLLYIYLKRPKDKLLMASLALIIAGGIGNMIDRLRLGYVIDMIEVEFINFPVFNVADCFITCGCVLLILHLIFFNKEFWKDGKK